LKAKFMVKREAMGTGVSGERKRRECKSERAERN
jgi:hypothetical protein